MHVIVSFKDLYKIVNDFMDICKYVLYACTVKLKDLYKIVNSLTGCWTVMASLAGSLGWLGIVLRHA